MALVKKRFESRLAASPERVWTWATSMPCINRELAPLMRMTHPPARQSLDDAPAEMELPVHLFDSWMLLFRVLPVDRSRVTFVELEPGHRFVERSPMLGMKLWQHERSVEAHDGGSRIVDTLTFEPRALAFVVSRFVDVLFRHRHAVLRRELG